MTQEKTLKDKFKLMYETEEEASEGLGKKVVFEEDRKVTMEKVINDVVQKINELISAQPKENSIKSKRNIFLNVHKYFFQYSFFKFPVDDTFTYEQRKKETWLYKIVNALYEKKYIDSFEFDGSDFIIQA